MSNVKVEQQSCPWKNEGYYASYEAAVDRRNDLSAHDRSGIMQYKIKRCGVNGVDFVVKSRQDPNVLAELAEIEEKMMKKKNRK